MSASLLFILFKEEEDGEKKRTKSHNRWQREPDDGSDNEKGVHYCKMKIKLYLDRFFFSFLIELNNEKK